MERAPGYLPAPTSHSNLNSINAFAHRRLHQILNEVPHLRTAPSGDVIPIRPRVIVTIEPDGDVIEGRRRLRGCSVRQRIQIRTGSTDRGAALYAQNCVPCHRDNGEGLPKVFPSLSGSPAVVGDPVELAAWVLSQKRPASIPAGRYPTQMLLFGWMGDPDAAALLTYIRSHFGNSAPPVDAAMIAKSREK